MFLPCSTCQAKEKKQRLVLFLGITKGFCRDSWAVSSHAHTGWHSMWRVDLCKHFCSIMSSQWRASHRSVCRYCMWERGLITVSEKLSPMVSYCGWRARQAAAQRCVLLPAAFHCYREGGDFLVTEPFPLSCSSFLMINTLFIILSNSTSLLEILSLI